jgi:hypothetical protein
MESYVGDESMSVGAVPKETLPLSDSNKQLVAKTASALQLAAGLLFLLGAVQIVAGLVAMIVLGAGVVGSLLMLVQGVFWVLLGVVLLTVSRDFKYLGVYTKYSGNHLRNAANGLAFFHQVLLGVGVIIALAVVVRMLSNS